MTNRVLMGDRGGLPGFYVSKPGVDVVTAGGNDLLLSSDALTMQIVESGSVTPVSSTAIITFADLGYRPLVLVNCQQGIYSIRYDSNTQITVGLGPGQFSLDSKWTVAGVAKPTLSNVVYYAVTNLPAY